jgi:hypothetical protein
MRLFPVVAALAVVLISTHHVFAFSSDPASGTNGDGSARYVDPDDQVRSALGVKGGESQDLDPDSSAVHRKLPARDLIAGQGVLAPNWFFSTAPRR